MLSTESIQIRDPFVIPVKSEGIYYLCGSTDKNIWGKGTGFDMYTSSDLVAWEGPYPAFRPDVDFYAEDNFWAPEIHLYKDRYYMFATFRRKDNGLLGTGVLVSDCIRGPYMPHSEEPITPKEWSSLDGTLFIDEEGLPWMVFCHEWQQVSDGEMCAVRLHDDLRSALGEPQLLFRASEAPWTTELTSKKMITPNNYVTDGPFLFRTSNGALLMLWASFIHNRYALGIARSVSGQVIGPWVHEEKPLYENDGGHGMVFRTFDDKLMLTIHTPNQTPEERPIFIELVEHDGLIMTADDRES